MDKEPEYVYRYIDSEDHAQAMLRGEIWVSTFEHIRKVDQSRADPNEGTMTYHVNHLDMNTPPDKAAVIRQRMNQPGGVAGNLEGWTITNCSFPTIVPDAFMLCTSVLNGSDKLRRIFGRYCIRISRPWDFCCSVAACLEPGVMLEGIGMGAMNYLGRSYSDDQPPVGNVYTANISGYADEEEFRFVWIPKSSLGIKPRTVKVPGIQKLLVLV